MLFIINITIPIPPPTTVLLLLKIHMCWNEYGLDFKNEILAITDQQSKDTVA